jgi:hypothetical protein
MSETAATSDQKLESTQLPPAVRETYRADKEELMKVHSRIVAADSIKDWSEIIADYISWGNRKVSGTTAIFNMNSAHGCPNRETQEEGESETGLCQVPWKMCYARETEKIYENSEHYRNRQEYLWDCIDPETFAEAFMMVVERKIKYGNLKSPSDVDVRFSESGDFRNNGDIYKADQIARILHSKGISAVYTYSASYKLEGWEKADDLITLQSVSREKAQGVHDNGEYGHKEYNAFTVSEEELESADSVIDLAPDGYVWCPHDLEKRQEGISSKEAIQCGDCRLCLEKDGPDIAIPIHA